MVKKAAEDLSKHTFHLFVGDVAKLQELYPELGAAGVIRQLVRTHIERVIKPVDTSKIKSEETKL